MTCDADALDLKEQDFSVCQNPDCWEVIGMDEEYCRGCREKDLRTSMEARNKLWHYANGGEIPPDRLPEFQGFLSGDEQPRAKFSVPSNIAVDSIMSHFREGK